ncbi:MAG: aldo/keto reductase [Lacisediminihabitans sp.]
MTDPPLLKLNDGRFIPQLGLGVYKVANSAAAKLVAGAIESGYRHVDTATFYQNEEGVGDGVRASGIPREQLFITTKVWNDDHGFDRTLRAFDASLARLGMDYVDLYLIHWPAPRQDLYVETWHALERLRDDGRARSIGVSNFHPHHLERLAVESSTVPAANQVELHPWLPQNAVRDYDEAHGILTEAWSPLARGRVLGDPVLAILAAKHHRTPAQIVIRWHLQRDVVVIPKSNSLERIRENADVFGFSLDDDDLRAIADLESGERTGLDPDNQG